MRRALIPGALMFGATNLGVFELDFDVRRGDGRPCRHTGAGNDGRWARCAVRAPDRGSITIAGVTSAMLRWTHCAWRQSSWRLFMNLVSASYLTHPTAARGNPGQWNRRTLAEALFTSPARRLSCHHRSDVRRFRAVSGSGSHSASPLRTPRSDLDEATSALDLETEARSAGLEPSAPGARPLSLRIVLTTIMNATRSWCSEWAIIEGGATRL